MKKIVSLLFLAVLCSCNQTPPIEKYDTQTLENKYSLLIPESLEQTDQLNKFASMQFKNAKQDFYIMVLDEPKAGFAQAVEEKKYNTTSDLGGYYKIVVDHFRDITSKGFKVYDIEKKKINSANAIVFSMSGLNDNYPVFYRYAVIESKERYYQIMSWTNTMQEQKYQERMNKIIDSFNIEENGVAKSKDRFAKEK
jgi:hypothetical protein